MSDLLNRVCFFVAVCYVARALTGCAAPFGDVEPKQVFEAVEKAEPVILTGYECTLIACDNLATKEERIACYDATDETYESTFKLWDMLRSIRCYVEPEHEKCQL